MYYRKLASLDEHCNLYPTSRKDISMRDTEPESLKEKRTSTPISHSKFKERDNDGDLYEKNAAEIQDISTIRSKPYLLERV